MNCWGRAMNFRRVLTLLCIANSIGICSPRVTESLQAAARKAHDDIPFLRRKEQERWTHVEQNLFEFSRTYERELYDNQQYSVNQYNIYQQNGDQLWNPSLTETEFGFDISTYAFKYTGCHDIGRKLRADNSPRRYATFRLCPSDSCSAKTTWGCKSDYGEYIVPLDFLMSSLIEHNRARVAGYCQYCQRCAAIEAYKQFYSEVTMHKEYVVNYAKQKFQKWCAKNGYSNSYSTTGNNDALYQTASQALWKEMRNGNYASNYVSQYHSKQGYSSSYPYAYESSYQQQWDRTSYKYTDEQKAWQTMGSTFGTWYDKTIYPGFYDSYGQFHACWGYNSDTAGRFICLDDVSAVYWDSDIFGSVPSTWKSFMSYGYLVDGTESCDSRYSSSCYNQYEACMKILSTLDRETKNYENNQLALTDVLECAVVAEEQMDYTGLYFYENYKYDLQQKRKHEEQYADSNKYKYDDALGDDDYIYVGPNCRDDSMSISLAVYGDRYCTKKIEQITVKDLLGYNPLDNNMDMFPSECIACQPPEDELVWYETERIDDPVLPFCSMLYQLAGKCNSKLKPKGRYDTSKLHTYENQKEFLQDTCSVVESLNKNVKKDQSMAKRSTDSIRMSIAAMTPASKAAFFMLVLLGTGIALMGYGYRKMQSALDDGTVMDIPEIPAFKYKNPEESSGIGTSRFSILYDEGIPDIDQSDSGVGLARDAFSPTWRRARKVGRSRTSPASPFSP